ncbi:hypothetical protein KC866_03110 [Patescibacteria group bacterium]|nr:hypothetical protein [Patescibacteria group bacterium]
MKKSNDLVYRFDIRYRDKNSDDLYEARNKAFSGDPEYSQLIKKLVNPLIDLNNKELFHNSKKIGVLKVNQSVSPQCLYDDEGRPYCGYFSSVSVTIKALHFNDSLDDAYKYIMKVFKEKKIHYVEIIPGYQDGNTFTYAQKKSFRRVSRETDGLSL